MHLMPKSRRVFLKVVAVGAAGTTVNLSCVGVVGDNGLSPPGGTGGAGPTQTGGSGGRSGAGGDGAGGDPGSGQGGSGGSGMGGQGDSGSDAGAPNTRDAGTDLPRDTGIDTGPPPRDAGVVLQPGDLAAGNVSSLPVGGLNALPNQSVAIGRDAMGVYALTLICTHQGCTAAPATTNGVRQINCPCHGSQFDRNGAVVRGPAARPLVHFSVTIDAAGNIVVHSNTQVGAAVRVVP